MSDKNSMIKPVAAAAGIALVSLLSTSTTVIASDNPFATADLTTGYMMADGHEGEEGSDGEEGEEGGEGEEGADGDKGEGGTCGEKGEEGKCGEGKCGGDHG